MSNLLTCWLRWDRNPSSPDATNAFEDALQHTFGGDSNERRDQMAMLRRAGWAHQDIVGVMA